jgi:hypothetical protein
MRIRRAATALACTIVCSAAAAAPAGAWAPAASAPIHPGVNTDTAGGSCTSNFIYTQGADVYIGQAAHCSSTGAATATNGCDSESLPEGTQVQVDGASDPGVMVYNSWVRMQARGETDPDTCQYNDLALVKLSAADAAKVNPSVPFWGGPTGLTDTVAANAKVVSYGNSILRQGIQALSPKEGVQLSQDSGGWNHTVYTVTPGLPGDSGSGFMDKTGKAFGVLSTVAIAPLPASNGVGDLARELAYARTFSDFSGVTLVNGTEAFRGPLLPIP